MQRTCETCNRALLSDALSLVIKAQRNGAFIYFESSSGPEGLQRRPDPHAFPLDAEDSEVLRFINAVLSPTRLVLRRHDADLNQVDALWEHPLESVAGDLASQVVPVAFTHSAVGSPDRVGGRACDLDAVGDHLGAEGGVEAVRAIDGDLSHSGMDAPCGKKGNELNGSSALAVFFKALAAWPLGKEKADWFKRVAKWPEGA